MKLRTLLAFTLGTVLGVWLSARYYRGLPGPECVMAPAALTAAKAPVAAPKPVRPKPVAIATPLPRPASQVRRAPVLASASPVEPALAAAPCPYSALGTPEGSFRCRCSREAADTGTVWGSGTYTSDSSICRAARHAGFWRDEGDEVTVFVRDGLAHYEGSEAFGVESQSYGAFPTSFSFN